MMFKRPKILTLAGYALLVCAVLLHTRAALAQYPGLSDPGARGTAGGANGGLVPVEPMIDGGKIPIGATAQVVVRFRNDGGQPVETGLIRLYPSSTVTATVALNQCEEEPLAAGAECAVALSVKGLQAGGWRLEMLMSHSGRTRLVTATVSGQVETSGDASDKLTSDVETIPDKIDFGTLDSSQTLTESVTLRNITSNPIDIKKVYIDAKDQSGFTLKADCKKLEAGQSCIAVVTWSPKQKGRSSGVLVVDHSGPAALSSVPLAGEYRPDNVAAAEVFPQAVPGRGLLVSSQTELDFGDGVETASTITVSLVNTGDSDLKLEDIKISGSDNGLSFKPDGCSRDQVLKPIQACPLTVTWSPTRIGSVFDDVQIVHDGARGVLVLPIRGVATATVSQDQKAITLGEDGELLMDSVPALSAGELGLDEEDPLDPGARTAGTMPGTNVNPASLLDGYKITSFSPTRAIINGPGGSRIVFDNEEIVLGGVSWFATIQQNGIEFMHNSRRILLLFDRSLSPVNRTSSSSESSGASSSSAPAAAPAAAPASGG